MITRNIVVIPFEKMTHKSQTNGSSGSSDSHFDEYDNEIIEVIYHFFSFCILFLSFGYSFNVISLCSFFIVAFIF